MFNSLREELNKIALFESDDELEELSDFPMDDHQAADDELVDDVDEDEEEMEDGIASGLEHENLNEASIEDIDSIINNILVLETAQDYYNECGRNCDCDDDDWEDDDEDSVDYQEGAIGDGNDDNLYDDDDEDDSLSGEIDGTTNSIKLDEDIYDDEEEELDDLLEAMDKFYADTNDVYGDSADIDSDRTPPSPQYMSSHGIDGVGRTKATNHDFVDGANRVTKYGKVFLDRKVLGRATVDDDNYDEEGNEYDLYASAGNIYDDDENEEYYGIRDKVTTKELYGRHSINNINATKPMDRFHGGNDDLEKSLDESVAAFLANYM